MADIIAFHGSVAKPIHPDWIARWAPDLSDDRIKADILKSSRFASRIADSLLEGIFQTTAPMIEEFDEKHRLQGALEQDQKAFLHKAGIVWFAPVLAPHIHLREHRERVGLSDRDVLLSVIEFRRHAAPELIGPLPEMTDFVAQGSACFCAWLGRFPASVADRVKLQLPGPAPSSPDQSTARADFFSRFIGISAEA